MREDTWYISYSHGEPKGIADEILVDLFIKCYSQEGHFVSITSGLVEICNVDCRKDPNVPCISFEKVSE